MKLNKNTSILALYALLMFISQTIYAKEFYLETWSSFLDLPDGLEPIEITDTKATFGTKDERIFFQIKVYPPETYSSAREIHNDVKNKIRAEGDGVDFYLNDSEAVFADY